MRHPQPCVGQTFAQRELPQPRIQQRLERVGQWAAEQLDRAGVDQGAQQRACAMAPGGGEVVKRLIGLGALAGSEVA